MDQKISAVLDTYHEMIRREREQPHGDLNHRFLAVGPRTGQLINVLARSLKAPTILELGTSFGYSGIWLAEAARAAGGHVITMEMQEHKSAFARDMAEKAGLTEHIDFRVGDAVQMIADLPPGIDFVLVDLWKDLYVPCLNAFLPKLNPGAIIVADNVGPSQKQTRDYVLAVRAIPHMTSIPVPVGQGLEISRFQAESASNG